VKNILHNYNEWAVIGIKPIVHVPLPRHNGTRECGYLVVEYFSRYLDKCGNREHCHGVEVSPETCYHHILTTISICSDIVFYFYMVQLLGPEHNAFF
jgi:hypothetical protein